jgi:hypothetical protein
MSKRKKGAEPKRKKGAEPAPDETPGAVDVPSAEVPSAVTEPELITVLEGAEQIEIEPGVTVAIPAGTYTGPEYDAAVDAALQELVGDAPPPDDVDALLERGEELAEQAEAVGAELDGITEQLDAIPPPKLDPAAPGPYLDAIGLDPAHILSSRIDGPDLIVVTVGGKKLRLPRDEAKARALTPGERDGVIRTTAHINTHPINAGRK